jgi:endonuclease/exonuclease/phosphatase family metal-dependent hydrolase
MKLISWNIARRKEAWRFLLDTDADIALLQEATEPPSDVASRIYVDDEPWRTVGSDANRPWRAAIVKLTEETNIKWLKTNSLEQAKTTEFGVSRRGTISAAQIETPNGNYTVVSMYALWERPRHAASVNWIYADASVHRLISDLSVLIGKQKSQGIIVAGDLNILYGYGEHGSQYWASRYDSVFKRMEALGLHFVGPQAPNGRQAQPWPVELPDDSNNVPTYHTTKMTPAQAERQLDFVFTSADLISNVKVSALNEPYEWGPSDHCRVKIKLDE